MRTILETRRLVLRELATDDLEFVASVLAHPEVMRYWPRPQTRDEAVDWIERQQARYARDGHGYWLAIEKESGLPVGQAGLLMSQVDEIDEPGLGYILDRPFWGQGFATEAAAGTLEYAFGARGYRRVICLVRPQNVPSLQVARRLGLTLERYVVYAGYDHLLLSATHAARAITEVSLRPAAISKVAVSAKAVRLPSG